MSLRCPINLRLDRVKIALFGGVFGSKMTQNDLFSFTTGPPGWTLPRPYLRVVDSIPDNLGIFGYHLVPCIQDVAQASNQSQT